MLDSAAVFEARCREMGLLPEEAARLKSRGWNSFALLAFACSYTPGQADDTNLVRLGAIITGAGAGDPPEDRMPIVRRLFFEAYTLAAADLRSRVDRREDDAPRKLALPERSQRNKDQAIRLSGVSLEGEREVSHALVDAVVQLCEDDQMRYIRWEQCTKRDAELMGIKSDPVWKPDPSGLIRETRVALELSADTSTDLLLRNALQRRSLAFDNCRLVAYSVFERWTDTLLDAYLSPAMSGYQRVSIEQLHRADLQLFKFVMRETRDGIRMRSDGSFPVEDAIRAGMQQPEVRLVLQPLQTGSSSKRRAESPEASRSESSDKQQKVIATLRGELASMRSKPSGPSSKGSGGKGSGKGKGKDKPARYVTDSPVSRMPRELIGMASRTNENDMICYDYNLGGCSKARPGESCPKGKHVCCRLGCFKAHSQRKHA